MRIVFTSFLVEGSLKFTKVMTENESTEPPIDSLFHEERINDEALIVEGALESSSLSFM